MNKNLKKLTKAEEEIMQILWKLEQGFVRDILDHFSEPQPHYNTVSTLLKILEEKGFVSMKKIGNAYLFTPVISKEVYSKKSANTLLQKYFNGSVAELLDHFVKEKNISVKELDSIIKKLKK